MIVLEDLTIGQLVEFLKIARPEDLKEVEAMTGHSILEEPVDLLKGAKAVIQREPNEPDRLLGIGGMEMFYGDGYPVAIPWLLLTEKIGYHPIEFLRFSKRFLKKLLKDVQLVSNCVYAENDLHIKWLTWLGCEWTHTPDGHKVFLFWREEEPQCAGE